VPTGSSAPERAAHRRLDRFYAVVAGPATWSRSGSTLTLTTPGKGSVRLTGDATAPPMVIGTHWHLTQYVGGHGYSHPPAKSYGLTIDSIGSLVAELNCASMHVRVAVNAVRIEFTDVSRPGCVLDNASAVIVSIVEAGSASYAIRGTELIIYGARGRLLVYDA
jgi:hypothetical protein